ncbi:hypothetical protein ACHAW6_009073 [Cyclotella cf. meneghiniana]
MNIFNFDRDESPPSSSLDEASHAAPPHLPHLDPAQVLALASNIPNCCRIFPPRSTVVAAAVTPTHRADSLRRLQSNSSAESSSGGVFSSFRRRLQRQFGDDDDDDCHGKRRTTFRDEMLSFLVSDPHYAMDTLRAALDEERQRPSDIPHELDGAGIARIDVYCRTGTVCTCRVVQGRLDRDRPLESVGESVPAASSSSRSPSAVLASLLATPRHRNVRRSDRVRMDCASLSSAATASFSRSHSPSSSNVSGGTRPKRALYVSTQNELDDDDDYDYYDDRGEHGLMEHLQVRRIFRRKVTLEGLRHILLNPPTLPEISADIIESEKEGDAMDHERDGSSRANDDNRPPQRRQNGRQRKQTQKIKLSGLSEQQRRFLYRERRKYSQRLRREEKTRQRLSNMILNGDDSIDHLLAACEATTPSGHGETWSCGTSVGSSDSWQTNGEESIDGAAASVSAASSKTSAAMDVDEISVIRKKQREIQQKIALADTAMAILMGEVESMERMMGLLQKDRGEECAWGDDSSKEDSWKERRHHPREGKRLHDTRERGREGKKHASPRLLSVQGTSSSCSRSLSVTSSRRLNDSFSTLENGSISNDSGSGGSTGNSNSCNSSVSLDDSEAEEIALMLQGCEVEYSFPYDFHDELEDALLAQEFATDGNDSYSSGVETDGDSTSRGPRAPANRRGRMRYRDGDGSEPWKDIPTIVAVPTNGQGCVVLRSNGAFSVVGTLPKPLYKQLFRKRGPFPEYIALGTRGRYYVRFEDGTFKFVGPSSLKACLIKTRPHESAEAKRGSRFFKNNKNRKDEMDNRQHPFAVASIAFGNKYEDFFLVRNDGSWEYNGDLPRSLEQLLQDRRGRGDLKWVSLGPNQEWCLKANNGRIWWGGVSKEVDEHLTGILIEDEENASACCHDLKFIDFGEDDTFFLLHR